MARVFVYGTLKQGYGNHRIIRDAKFLGRATCNDALLTDLGAFPALSFNDGRIDDMEAPSVAGELYDADEHMVRAMDRLEGHPNFYLRQTVVIEDKDGKFTRAYTYVMQDVSRYALVEANKDGVMSWEVA